MRNFKELLIWQKARELVKIVYLNTERFPSEEKFGLISQMRRASISVASNIAEGSGKESEKEFLRFLETSYSSAFELETQFLLATDLNFIDQKDSEFVINKIQEVQKMVYSFSKSIKNNIK